MTDNFLNKKQKREQKENIPPTNNSTSNTSDLPSKKTTSLLTNTPIHQDEDSVYSSLTKNSKLKLLYKVLLPYNKILTTDNPFISIKEYTSLRNDKWTMFLSHEFNKKSQTTKITVDILVEQTTHSPQQQTTTTDNIIQDIINSLNFSLDVNVTVITSKSHSYPLIKIPSINYNTKLTVSEIILPEDTYNTTLLSSSSCAIVLVELLITRNYSKIHLLPYNGIINEGATCYVNSLLQTLSSVCLFRKAVFQIPTDKDDYSSIALALQRLFYDLMCKKSPATTKILLNSFGWSKEQALVQHDVQEFNLKLSDILQERMKGTLIDGTYNAIFEGKLMNYIQCLNVNCNSEKIEKFIDLQLTIKNYKNIYNSLDAYTEEELLDNEDKYETDKYGKQVARKGIKFLSFPPVLTLQLKRFEYNSKLKMMVKINDSFEYYEELDLNKYIHGDNINKEDNIYTLHSVVVHQGTATNGHYFAFIKPSNNKGEWLQFNDEEVKPAEHYEIFNQNFGGSCERYKHKGKGEITYQSVNSDRTAYILHYMRKNKETELVDTIDVDSIPHSLKRRFENEVEEEKKIKRKKIRNNENVNILLISTQNCIDAHKNKLGIVNSLIDLNIDFPLIYNTSYRMLINFPKCFTFNHLLDFISQQTSIPTHSITLYDLVNGDSMQMILQRQDYDLIPIYDLNTSINDYKVNNKRCIMVLFIYIKGNYKLYKEINLNSDFTEEMTYNMFPEKLIYFSKTMNQFSFNKNNIKSNTTVHNKNNIDINNQKIIFIKYYNSNNQTLDIVKVFDIDITVNELYNTILNEIKGKPISILIEKTSPLPLDLKESSTEHFLTSTNCYNILSTVTSLILIPIYQSVPTQEIILYLQDLNNTIYVDCYTSPLNPLNRSVIKKLKINLSTTTDEYMLKSLILNHLKEKRLLMKCINIKDNSSLTQQKHLTLEHYFLNHQKQLLLLKEQELKLRLTEDNIEFDIENDCCNTKVNKEFKILNLLNITESRLLFKLTLYSHKTANDCYYQDFYLYDIHNNEQCVIGAMIPKKVRKCSDFIEYLIDSINQIPGYSGYTKHNLFFILQSSSRNFIYQLCVENAIELKSFENKAKDIEYRIQPFNDNEIEKFYSNKYKKVFVSFGKIRFGKIHPMVMFVDKNECFANVKVQIEEMIKNTKQYAMFEGIKFEIFKASVINGKLLHDNIHHIKDEDTLNTLYNNDYGGPINLYIHFI